MTDDTSGDGDPLVENRRCPDCDGGPLQLRTKPNRWVCVDCGANFSGDPPDDLVPFDPEG